MTSHAPGGGGDSDSRLQNETAIANNCGPSRGHSGAGLSFEIVNINGVSPVDLRVCPPPPSSLSPHLLVRVPDGPDTFTVERDV